MSPDPSQRLILTCEHGGNRIPKSLAKVFQTARRSLDSHRGWDIGALVIARGLHDRLQAPLISSDISRLVVDLNRSIAHKRLFSEWTDHLPAEKKADILSQHYLPYRNDVERLILSSIKRRRRVLHLSVHSFTPVMHQKIRNCEIGLLYDPSRPLERSFARRLKENLAIRLPDLRVRFNYPYRGTADGLTTHLRALHSAPAYSGIEIELNQKLLKKAQQRKSTNVLLNNLAWSVRNAQFFIQSSTYIRA